jgi:hypothetical protein
VNRASVPALRGFVVLALVATLAACGVELGGSPTPAPRSTAGAGATATDLAPTSFGPPPSPTPPDDSTPLTLDPTLLAFLPAEVDGIAVTEEPDVLPEALGQATLPRIATAIDAAVAVDAGNGNLVTAWVLRLRQGVFTVADYGQWRDSYDEGACAAAGGVVGRAEATIGGRQAYVTSCVTGLRTYHVWLQDQGILISASSIGDGRFGEKLLEGLRVPA